MKKLTGTLACGAMLLGLFGGAAFADSDELMPCKLIIVKSAPAGPRGYGITKFVCRPSRGESFALPSFPALFARISVNTIPPGTFYIPLEAVFCHGLGDPPDSKGYKCTDYFWTLAVIKEKVVKVLVKQDVPALAGTRLPFSNDVGILVAALGAGGAQKLYCATFPVATALISDDTQFKAKDAPAPAACQ